MKLKISPKYSLTGTWPPSSPVSAFTQQRQSRAVVTDTAWATNPKMFTTWSFKEKVSWALF